VTAWFNLSPQSHVRLHASDGDSRWVHTGDSIATGTIGISSPAQHYVARASSLAAPPSGLAARRGLHTSGAHYSGGRIRATRVRSDEPSALFGARSWLVPTEGELVYSPHGTATSICVVHIGGGFRYRVDEDGWNEVAPNGGVPAVLRVNLRHSKHTLRVTSSGPPVRILGFESADSGRPALTWYTSGVGGARIADLHRALSAKGELGYASYGALAPDLLTIGIGVNDTIHADAETVSRSARALKSVIERMYAHGVTRIALVGAGPVRRDFQPGPWFVDDAYAGIYRPVALQYGLPLLEVAAAWAGYESARDAGYLADQVHPTAQGHRAIAVELAGAFAKAGVLPPHG
jgi:lysophospholipase L1-like esterase